MNNGHHQEAINKFLSLMENVDEKMKNTFQNMHHGYPTEPLVRFLKARDWNVQKAHKMLIDCLQWRLQNEIDNILSKPIIPVDLYRAVRDSQLVGVSGYSKEGHPVIAIGIGLSTYDKASVNYYVQSHIQMNEYRDRVVLPTATEKYGRHISTCLKILDMTGLKLSALNQIKLLSTIATIDDLNYPEKTGTYYIVNVPYIFSACWKAVKPLLQERTKRKIQVLQGCGRDELLKIMDYSSLPHFCRKEGSGSGSGSSRNSSNGTVDNCFSLDHTFHQQLYNYIKQQSTLIEASLPIRQGSVHVKFPKPGLEDTEIVKTIQTELDRFADQNAVCNSMNVVKVNGD
ncbi:hypothetical protein ES319_D05G424800v1 [Gossypium barbadense]|uniref:CRAL-TRIO domain-containing protein n=1 Tax=Gossypium barbadense TaxID=3634 RepID=A0A5J5RPZ6_GOSBA|nr:hypothetical protein ES319_D05G424800v1 [Gossypium barbadense]